MFIVFFVGSITLMFRARTGAGSVELLRYNHDTITGYVIGYTRAERTMGGFIHYWFSLNGKTYENEKMYDTVYDYMAVGLWDTPLTILYQIGDTDNNTILIRKEEYMKYGLPFPASLAKYNVGYQ